MEEKAAFTTREVANFLGVSSSTVYRMERQGLITAIRTPGGQRRFSKDNIDRYLDESQGFAAPQNPSKYRKGLVEEVNPAVTTAVRDRAAISYDYEPAELFFHRDSLYIYNADVLQIRSLGDNSIDLIVTSPPYNVDIKYNSHDDTMSYSDYLLFTREWLGKCYGLLKNDGRLCLNIPLDKNKGGQQSVYADILTIAKQEGFRYHSTVIWNEQNISRRTARGSSLSAAAPCIMAPVEVIVILYKKVWKKTSGSRVSDITKKEFLELTNGVWKFSGESRKRIRHPAPFPVELPRRCIKLFSFVGDTVLDPFLGNGSTLLACFQTGRVGIGVDIDRKYCELAKKRLMAEANIDQLKLSAAVGAG